MSGSGSCWRPKTETIAAAEPASSSEASPSTTRTSALPEARFLALAAIPADRSMPTTSRPGRCPVSKSSSGKVPQQGTKTGPSGRSEGRARTASETQGAKRGT
ncbi:hypothetical protein AORI_2898 [Amycolatopsis keratiniphila]|uniref:Uncharacterized protein n=1 Tax=Amycolatopsis keratiniphila TaxID=129921 RepID=R4SPQ7_9PSEU|nr:hypothetical protein AORI_2898 [Amycolatopsis keratiniphila]